MPQRSHACACSRPGSRCLVVFYTVDTAALVYAEAPGAEPFTGTSGEPTLPKTRCLVALFHGAAGERSDRIQAHSGPGAPALFDEVRLAPASQPLLHNSVVLVPDLLTEGECAMLLAAADGACADRDAEREGLQRARVCDLCEQARELSAGLLVDRLLPFLERQIPRAAEELFGRSEALGELCFSFSPLEPAVNRYTTGGEFKVHRDLYSVTVNVLLSEPEAFVGGGTAFYPQDAQPGVYDAEAGVLLRPRRGAGVVFNGDVLHAGRQVEAGVRHLYVASFHLEPAIEGRWWWDRTGRFRLTRRTAPLGED